MREEGGAGDEEDSSEEEEDGGGGIARRREEGGGETRVEDDDDEELARTRGGNEDEEEEDDWKVVDETKRSGESIVAVTFRDSLTPLHDIDPQLQTTASVPSLAVTICLRTRAATLR